MAVSTARCAGTGPAAAPSDWCLFCLPQGVTASGLLELPPRPPCLEGLLAKQLGMRSSDKLSARGRLALPGLAVSSGEGRKAGPALPKGRQP